MSAKPQVNVPAPLALTEEKKKLVTKLTKEFLGDPAKTAPYFSSGKMDGEALRFSTGQLDAETFAQLGSYVSSLRVVCSGAPPQTEQDKANKEKERRDLFQLFGEEETDDVIELYNKAYSAWLNVKQSMEISFDEEESKDVAVPSTVPSALPVPAVMEENKPVATHILDADDDEDEKKEDAEKPADASSSAMSDSDSSDVTEQQMAEEVKNHIMVLVPGVIQAALDVVKKANPKTRQDLLDALHRSNFPIAKLQDDMVHIGKTNVVTTKAIGEALIRIHNLMPQWDGEFAHVEKALKMPEGECRALREYVSTDEEAVSFAVLKYLFTTQMPPKSVLQSKDEEWEEKLVPLMKSLFQREQKQQGNDKEHARVANELLARFNVVYSLSLEAPTRDDISALLQQQASPSTSPKAEKPKKRSSHDSANNEAKRHKARKEQKKKAEEKKQPPQESTDKLEVVIVDEDDVKEDKEEKKPKSSPQTTKEKPKHKHSKPSSSKP